jgi:sulfate transport system substrate-binding protein
LLAARKLRPGLFDVVVPTISILAEPPVAWVDGVVRRKGSEGVARAYLEFLYSVEAQEAAARHFYRPSLPEVAAR